MIFLKTILKQAIAAATLFSFTFGLISFLPAGANAQVRRERPPTTESTETLTGDKAVESLKSSGGYDSLRDAFMRASNSSGDGSTGTQNLFPGTTLSESGLVAADGTTNDNFGWSVSISGYTAVIGAYQQIVGGVSNLGSVYVFTRSGSTWTLEQKLNSSDGAANDRFGWSVSIDGDTLLVGAYQDTVGANVGQGSAYVFTRSGTTWTQQAKFTASDGAASDNFGQSVSLSGNTALVGAFSDDGTAGMDQGAAYVFTGSGTTWSQQAKLTASDAAAGDNFGYSVSLSGNTALVGSYLDTVGANATQGSAYVYTRSGTTWSQQQKLTASDGAASDRFGNSVSISGDTALVGANTKTVGANATQGAAYVFTRSGTTWSQQQKLTATDGAATDRFGTGVAVLGDTAVIGAYFDLVGTNSRQGSAYVFTRSGTTWTQDQKLTASDGAAGDRMGWSVALSSDAVLVGIYNDTVGTNTGQGSAKIFQAPLLTSKKTASDGTTGDLLGYSVAISGDTAVVGAAGANGQQGAAYVFVRSGSVWSQQAKLTANDGAPMDYFGNSVSISGDTAVVGAYQDDVGANADQGSVYIFIRSGATWALEQKVTASDGGVGNAFGNSVSIDGDTAVIGAPSATVNGVQFAGAAYVMVRASGVWSQQAILSASDGAIADNLGTSISISGNTVVAGAARAQVGANLNQGVAYVFTRSGTNWTQQQKLTASDGAANDNFGYSASVSGDTAVVGANTAQVGSSPLQGSVYIFTRSGTTWTRQQKLIAPDGTDVLFFGQSVSIYGDTALVGAGGWNNSQGAAYMFQRNGNSWALQRQLIATDGLSNDVYGWGVAISSNTAIVGAYNASIAQNNFNLIQAGGNEGASYMYYWGPLSATAAGAHLTGRVTTPEGRGLSNAMVVVTDSNGKERVTQTGTFGQFAFENLPSGETYVLTVRSRRYQFMPQAIELRSDLDGVKISAVGSRR